MSDLTGLISKALQGNALKQLSRQIGAGEQQTQSAAMAALPALLGAMKRNASTPEGASALSNALEQDHDGGILDHLGSFLGGSFRTSAQRTARASSGTFSAGSRKRFSKASVRQVASISARSRSSFRSLRLS